jgi:membrane protein required for colicin V production
MNWLDIAFVLVLFFSIVGGLLKGFVREIFGIIGTVAGLVLAITLSPSLAPRLARWLMEPAAYAAAFLGIFFVTMMVAGLIGHIATKVLDAAHLSLPNRLLGGLFGFVRGSVLIVVLFWGLLFFVDNPERILADSRLAPTVYKAAQWLGKQLPGRESWERGQSI